MRIYYFAFNKKTGKTYFPCIYDLSLNHIETEEGIVFSGYEVVFIEENKNLNQIWFVEDISFGYKERTIKNATADITLAFAYDFNSAGEVLTKKSCIEQGNTYIPIKISKGLDIKMGYVESIKEIILGLYEEKRSKLSVNIAGNGLYTFDQNNFNIIQKDLDYFIYNYFDQIFTEEIINKLYLLRSGGQTGVDEAGIKAAFKLKIPTLCLAPKGWRFRDRDGIDTNNEKDFKQRFFYMRKTWSGEIVGLKTNQIFVFGSNTQGIHGKGAAKIAHQKFGAVYGVSRGPTGKCYAICTKDLLNLSAKSDPSIHEMEIVEQIEYLYVYAYDRPSKEFLICYPKIEGVSLNGYTSLQMAMMFVQAAMNLKIDIPENCIFEKGMWELIEEYSKNYYV